MGKFLWNVACVILLAVNLFALAYCFIEQTAFSGLMLLAVAAADVIYAEKRPTYIKF